MNRLTPRRLFHALLWSAMTLECVAYVDVAGLIALARDPSTAVKVGYVLLEVIGRAMLEFTAFATVTILWFDTAKNLSTNENGSKLMDCLPRILLGTAVILSVASIWAAVDILTSAKDASWVFRGHNFIESIAWGIQAITAVVCTWLTAQRISRLCMLPHSDDWTRFKVVSKPLVPMVLCAICYTVRAVWLFCLFVTMPMTSNLADRYGLAYWIAFCWIPTLVPSTMLLYSARKRDPTPDHQDDRLRHALLPTPVPPAEAFISFRKFRENHDFFSPLSLDPRAQEGENLFEPPDGEIRTSLGFQQEAKEEEKES
jgi:hypothetical protein